MLVFEYIFCMKLWSWSSDGFIVRTIAYVAMNILSVRVCRFLRQQFHPILDCSEMVTLSPEEKYKKTAKQRFLDIYSRNSVLVTYNSNIEPVFYLRPQYQTAIALENNALETAWKRRILMETTPRGNIIMYYNAYKRGFAYFSDQTIPYDLLNAVAMKYVVTFRCLHFFLDEQVVPSDYASPFVQLYELEDAKPGSSGGSGGTMKVDVSKGPFAKFKGGGASLNSTIKNAKQAPLVSAVAAGGPKSAVSGSSGGSKDPVPPTLYFKNRFVYLGKMSNCSLLQSVPSNKRRTLDPLSKGKVVTPEGSYTSYKFWRTLATEPMA